MINRYTFPSRSLQDLVRYLAATTAMLILYAVPQVSPHRAVSYRELGSPILTSVHESPLLFEPNVGQVAGSIRFLAHNSASTVYFSPSEITLQMGGYSGPKLAQLDSGASHLAAQGFSNSEAVLYIDFVGSNPSAEVESGPILPGKVSYFHGNDSSKWRTNIPTYASITYTGLYPGIDLMYSGTGAHDQLKGTYTIASGADPSVLRWRYQGTDEDAQNDPQQPSSAPNNPPMSIDGEGNLHIRLGGADITEQAPDAWQNVHGKRSRVTAGYILSRDGSVGFKIGAYDSSQPLVIDPLITYSTFLGGSDIDSSHVVAVDSQGNVYVAGTTNSLDFPVVNAIQSKSSGNGDVFIAKLDSSGANLVYATYLGGTNLDVAWGITVDDQGSVYVAGNTNSSDFPVENPYQPVRRGQTDAFISKLSSDGSHLIYSTYLGGGYVQDAYAVAVDAQGQAVVTGVTASSDFPTADPYQPNNAGGDDAFITQFSVSGQELLFSTYLGGNSNDTGFAVSVDDTGKISVAGGTGSINFPVVNPFQPTYGGGNTDGFFARLDPADSTLLYSTYLGGEGNDGVSGIARDSSGSVFLTGYTWSVSFPVYNAFQPALVGEMDAFVTKMRADGPTLVYSTYLGGAGHQNGAAIAIDGQGNAYITGETDSPDYPLVDPVQAALHGPSDAFISKLNDAGTRLIYSTYLGGSSRDLGWSIAADVQGNTYVTGDTISPDFPTAGSPPQPRIAGSWDGFITKIDNTCTLTFTDVPLGSPFYANTRCLACRGIISGYNDGTFRPDNNITRGQIAKMVSNAVGFSDNITSTQQVYQDVSYTNTFWIWIERLTSHGVMAGYPCGALQQEPCVPPQNRPYFRWSNNATRAQLAKIVSNAANFQENHTDTMFTDVPPTDPFYQFIARLADRGVMAGYPCGIQPAGPCDMLNRPWFLPHNNVTRGQAAKIVANTFYPNCQTSDPQNETPRYAAP